MFSMFLDSARLFLQGKLFRDNGAVFRSWVIGFAVAMVLLLGVATYVNFWLGAVVSGLVGGALMPYLFRHLKYN